jgi:hypothetical protein
MPKAIKNDRSGIIHAAYDTNLTGSFCGGLGAFSGSITVMRFKSARTRDSVVTCKRCLAMIGVPDPLTTTTTVILENTITNIKDNIKIFSQSCLECENMITDMMETTNRCRHRDNRHEACDWVFCPLRR